jgi:hypothetical protein
MPMLIFSFFKLLFRMVGLLILGGVLVLALTDIQKRAFQSKTTGLTSMLQINQQLVGKTKPWRR